MSTRFSNRYCPQYIHAPGDPHCEDSYCRVTERIAFVPFDLAIRFRLTPPIRRAMLDGKD